MFLFAQIVKSGSISAAADEVGLSKSVLSQHLKGLEIELGVTLLKRTTRRQTLTVAGERFYWQCQKLNHIAHEAWQEALEGGREPIGAVRITAPHALMDSLVVHVINKLIHTYPRLQPQLIGNDQHMDISMHNIDLAIRVGPSRDSNFKQKRIGGFRDVLCGNPSRYADLAQAPYVANVWQGKTITHHMAHETLPDRHYTATPRCVATTFHCCLALIRAGAGIGLVPDFYLADMSEELSPVFPGYQLPVNPVYALHPFSQQLPRTVEVCLKAIEAQLQ